MPVHRRTLAPFCLSQFILLAAGAASSQAQSLDVHGTLLTASGAPIAGASCRFKNIANVAVTDAAGKFSFTGSSTIRGAQGYSLSAFAQGDRLILDLDRGGKASLDVFAPSGRMLKTLLSGDLAAGRHALSLAGLGSSGLLLLRVAVGSAIAWHKVTAQGGIFAVTGMGAAAAGPAAKLEASGDSLYCTHDGYYGGLAAINGRSMRAYSGEYGLRMFSSDPAWKARCGLPMTFNFDSSAGVTRYKQLIADPAATEQEVLTEVCQAMFKRADQPKKYSGFTADVKKDNGVAATGGNHLFFNADYIAGQPDNYAGWWEVVGVQTHEAVHTFQPYYNTAGADGFGEAMPDAVRAVNGFFRWPTGTKCSGAFTDVYQTGGKYWYFIEMRHPGFLSSVWQNNTGDISARVQSITGESLSGMVSECQTQGMP